MHNYFFFFGNITAIYLLKNKDTYECTIFKITIKFYVFLSASDKSNNFKGKYQLNFILFSIILIILIIIKIPLIIKNQLLFN